MYNEIKKTVDLQDGRQIEISTGKLAKQADGSVVVKMGNTMLLATVVSAKTQKEGVDFMPLSCEYKEKFAAVGRYPGGFLKREARPSDYEILISRLIDRALRPLFPADFHAETFVQVQLMSAAEDVQADALAGLAASAALAVSTVPFQEPISEVRVSRINGEFIINPTFSQNKESDIDLIVAATMDNIMMVEGEMLEVSEEEMLEAIKVAHEAIKVQCQVQIDMAKELGIVKREVEPAVADEDLRAKIKAETYDKVYAVAIQGLADKHKRAELFANVKEEFLAQYSEEELAELNTTLVDIYYHDIEKEAVRRAILDDGIRLDGRKTNEIRPIWCEIDVLPSTHGSSIFTRGETQSITTVTLGSKLDEKRNDDPLVTESSRFILHYNFPAFSTGDARPNRGLSRREVGHGNLALRALKPMIPKDSPFVIRVVSDILESNGSSSMATVCAGTLALMDTGVPMKKPVSGIAMGLITDNDKFAVLSDILGDEDHLGDMDFKVTGTRDGITATQMDIKVDGLSYEVLKQALLQAREGRLHILDIMQKTIAEPRAEYKAHAPKIHRMEIDKEFIGAIIGPGGKNIQELQAATETTITIEEVDKKGIVEISGVDPDKMNKAIERIKMITYTPSVGDIFDGKVKAIRDFGAFVEFMPGHEALLHISEIEHRRLKTVAEVLKEGDIVKIKIIGIEKNGKLRLSRKVLLPKPERNDAPTNKKDDVI